MKKNAAHWDKHELLVVFDGTEEELRAYDWPGLGVTYTFTGKQVGVGGAKNFGANRFFTEDDDLVMFADNDMYYLRDWDSKLEAGVSCVTQLGGWKHPYHKGTTFTTLAPINGIGLHTDLQKVDAVTGNCFVMTYKDWLLYGPFDSNAIGPGQSEDFALSQKIKAAGGLIATLDPPIAIHCGITNSLGEPAVGAQEMSEMAARQIEENEVEEILIEAPEVGLIKLRRPDNPDPVVKFRGLNVGSGQRRFDTRSGWVNVDCVSRPPFQVPDIVLDATKLTEKFEENSQDMVSLVHTLEHFGCGEANLVVENCFHVLKPSGSLVVIVPDIQKLSASWLGGELDTQTYFTTIYGAYLGEEGDRHKWGFTLQSLIDYLNTCAVWNELKLFDYRAIAGSDYPKDWWMLAVEAVK